MSCIIAGALALAIVPVMPLIAAEIRTQDRPASPSPSEQFKAIVE
jgi:hypothetical protein